VITLDTESEQWVVEALAGVLYLADSRIGFNIQWLLFSIPFEVAVEKYSNLRCLCLIMMNVEMMIRLIGCVNQPALSSLQKKVTNTTRKYKNICFNRTMVFGGSVKPPCVLLVNLFRMSGKKGCITAETRGFKVDRACA